MANGMGQTIVDFGAAPGSCEASQFVSAPTIGVSSKIEVWIAGSVITDHTVQDHRWAKSAFGLTVSNSVPSAGSGFTVYGISTYPLEGMFAVDYVWSD